MTIDSADDSKISNRTINTNRISNRTYDSKSNRITKLRRSLSEVVHQLWWNGVATLPWGARDIHLYFNQHYKYAPGAFCYALSTAGTSTATGQSLQLVEVWPYLEEKSINTFPTKCCDNSVGFDSCIGRLEGIDPSSPPPLIHPFRHNMCAIDDRQTDGRRHSLKA